MDIHDIYRVVSTLFFMTFIITRLFKRITQFQRTLLSGVS